MDDYELGRELGAGGFARVSMAVHKFSKLPVAVKMIAKQEDSSEASKDFFREISILQKVDHPFVCKLFDYFETETDRIMVMEYVPNGSLLDRINLEEPISENEARAYVIQILIALEYLHSLCVCHRDITPENIHLDSNGNVRLIDFGLSTYFDSSLPLMRTICGTVAYVAPEILRGDVYTPSTDIWSLGVILFAMIAGKLPFQSHDIEKMKKRILKEEPSYPRHFSRELTNLLRGMLCKDGIKRFSISQLKEHSWFGAGLFRPLDLDARRIEEEVEKKWSELGLVESETHSEQVGRMIMKRIVECEELHTTGTGMELLWNDRQMKHARRLKYESGAVKLQQLCARRS
jgi:5'-AMP-activated protein kinase catalytic alpha subunit